MAVDEADNIWSKLPVTGKEEPVAQCDKIRQRHVRKMDY
jgi:hypothetical protein